MELNNAIPAITSSQLKELSQQLQRCVSDLHQVNFAYGLLRVGLLLSLLLIGAWCFWRSTHWAAAIAGLLFMSFAEFGLLICTHEASHGTLLGNPSLERLLSCLISWPMGWPTLSYGILHRFHHLWNGHDPRDPERIIPADGPWLWRIFGLGGLGLISSVYQQVFILRHEDPRICQRLGFDLCGSFLVMSGLLIFALQHGLTVRLVLSWLVVERISGALLQYRALVEHWGLWGVHATPQLTQLYASRTIGANRLVNGFMGGLPHHSVHHCFPFIPFDLLPLATQRIESVLNQGGLPALPRCESYFNSLSLFK